MRARTKHCINPIYIDFYVYIESNREREILEGKPREMTYNFINGKVKRNVSKGGVYELRVLGGLRISIYEVPDKI